MRRPTLPMPRAAAGWLALAAFVSALGGAQAAQFFDTPEVEYTNQPYDGRFVFARVRFSPSIWGPGPHAWGLDLKWNHDYPRADRHLEQILDLMTNLQTVTEGGNIVRIGDAELFDYPWAYLSEPGFLTLTAAEADNLRSYLLKGGFLVADDFNARGWYHFVEQMRRVMPEGEWIELDGSHPIFHSFFDIRDPRFTSQFAEEGFQLTYGDLHYLALFEDNDPDKRMLVIANYNNDIGEYWEWSESPYVPIDLSNEAYKLGVNYVIYAMTH